MTATHGLYERHAARIHGYCLHQLGSREEAEDAVQTTFMNAFRALRKGVVPEAEAAWLFKIAENVCLSRRRSSWRRNRIESPADFAAIEEIVPGPNRQRDELIGIEDALASMPEQQRRAILLREWQGLSYREIAAELELSQSAVETLIFRARRSLAQGLTEPHKPQARRKGFRRALHVFDVTTLLAAAKSLLAGSAAVKATTAAVAVTAIAGGAATVAPDLLDHPPKPALTVVDAGLTPAASASRAFSRGEGRVPAAAARASASIPDLVPVRMRAVTARPVPRASTPARPAVAALRRGDAGRGSERRAAKPKPAPSKGRRATTPATEQPKQAAAPPRSAKEKPAQSQALGAGPAAKTVSPKTGLGRAPSAAVTRKAATRVPATSKRVTTTAATSKPVTSTLRPEKPAKAAVAPAAAPATDAGASSDGAVSVTEPAVPNGRGAAKAARDK
ncbi:MAG TPA: sigma-70 family RNA polymerase sigma factor [Solirubrobacteraceae bacterium]|nr:sigma-70 family RNA polymerase sigma factor [Solirubrobacteraceae bacterium]